VCAAADAGVNVTEKPVRVLPAHAEAVGSQVKRFWPGAAAKTVPSRTGVATPAAASPRSASQVAVTSTSAVSPVSVKSTSTFSLHGHR